MAPTVESFGNNTTSGGADNPSNTVAIGVYIARFDLRNFGTGDNVRVWAEVNVDKGAGVVGAVITSVDVIGPIDDGSDGAKQVVELGPLVATGDSSEGVIRLWIEKTLGTNQSYYWQLIKVN